jgi:hypothetical protein
MNIYIYIYIYIIFWSREKSSGDWTVFGADYFGGVETVVIVILKNIILKNIILKKIY